MTYFDCDYMAGCHPSVLQRLNLTNMECTAGYGLDPYSERARRLIRDLCACPDAQVSFLVGGTQTNATAIDGLLLRHQGVIAADTAHINVHEAGAIEAAGHKVLSLPSEQGKVQSQVLENYLQQFYADDTWQHMVQPGMLYLSQPTELGTLYSLYELEQLSAICRQYHLSLYIDGARLSYALAAEQNDVSLADLARLTDAFYIGGTKTGLLFGEALVVPRPNTIPALFSLVKQHGALLAKGRLLGLQFETLLTDQLYLSIARKAVSLAQRLKNAFLRSGYTLFIDSPTNQQFIVLPNEVIEQLHHDLSFELWGSQGENESVVRFVTSWATEEKDIDTLEQCLASLKTPQKK